MLRTYNVGETDRFCILLTQHHGRIAARAAGVRRLLSRRGGGLLPLHHVRVVCETHSFGCVLASVSCIDAHAQSWQDPMTLSRVQQGIELLLRLTEDGSPMPEVFALTRTFIAACALPQSEGMPLFFALKLLLLLGSCPSLTHSSASSVPLQGAIVFSSRFGGLASAAEDPHGRVLSPALVHLLSLLDCTALPDLPSCDTALLRECAFIAQGLLGSQLGSSLKAEGVSLAMSSAVAPI